MVVGVSFGTWFNSVNGVGLVIVFLIMLFIVALVLIRYVIISSKVEKVLNKFTSGAKFIGNRLTLPTKIVVNVGLVKITGLWVNGIESDRYAYDVRVINSKQLDTSIVDIGGLCSSTPYIYVDLAENVYIETPGFIVISPKEFKDVIALCVDTSRIQEKRIELNIDDYPDMVRAFVKLTPRGFETSLVWSLNAPKRRKIVYNKESDLYKVIEEYNAKTKAKGVSLELCFQGPEPTRKCSTVIEISDLDKVATNIIEFNLGTPMMFIHKNMVGSDLFTFLYNTTNMKTTPIVIGYKEGFISARLILKKSSKKNVVKEVDL